MSERAHVQFPDGGAVVVTGAGSGIGRATAELAAAAGLKVALWDISAEAVERVAEQLRSAGADVVVAEADITDQAAIDRAFAASAAALGHLDYLVNNAGPTSHLPRPFVDGLQAAAGSVEMVTEGWLRVGRHEGDAVVNVSSVAGTHTGVGAEGWYPAAKAAIAGYTRFLALQRPGGIRANAVAPGVIRTPRNEEFIAGPGQSILERNPMGRAGEPAEVAAAICFLLSPGAAYVNGVILPVDGGSLVTL